jgi:phospholipase/lecithinase/hemolysin
MKQKLGLIQKLQLTALAGLVLLGLTFGGLSAQACYYPFNHIFVFGDSLSDTGNYYRLSGGLPPPPYADGRYCNGPLWPEYLAASLRMDYQPADNVAVAGATTGTHNVNNGVAGKTYPGLLDEIASFQANSSVAAPELAIYMVEAGGNDFFNALTTGASPQTVIVDGVNNTLTAVQRLWGSGARFIVVMNLPDLGVTPIARSMGLTVPLTQMCAAYNQALDMALDNLAQAGIPTIRLDAFKVLHEMACNPEAYGFSDVTTPLISVPSAPNPDEFLFWDLKHPTTAAHKVLAKEALGQIIAAFSPSNGKATPDAKANSLHGLVNASVCRP